MESVSHKIVGQDGREVGTIELDGSVFNAPIKMDLVHATVRWQLAKRRAGTHKALTKGEMEGGAKKPWRQKGTGKARAGTATSPVWVGGAVAHGPQPRDYDLRITKRARRQALASILSDKRANNQLVIVDSLSVADNKTKSFAAILRSLGIEKQKTLVVLSGDEGAERASRNINRLTALPVEGVNAYDLLKSDVVVSTREGIQKLEERVKSV